MAGNDGRIDPLSYMQGQMAANGRASVAEAQAGLARTQARLAGEQTDQTLMALGFMKKQVDAWRARFERERADRRGWQRNGIAARELIQKLANVDREGAQKMIDACAAENKDRLDKSIAGIDEWNFTGVKPTSN